MVLGGAPARSGGRALSYLSGNFSEASGRGQEFRLVGRSSEAQETAGQAEQTPAWRVVDLFSGAGGMSAGFARHPKFVIMGAADAQRGKPSSRDGTLGCNATYELNIGVAPIEADLATVDPVDLADSMGVRSPVDVLTVCPPCTGFSRTLARNHVVDDPRNSLVGRTAFFVRTFRPALVVMENARELLRGRFAHHFARLRQDLEELGYRVSATTHMLDRFGLPQTRERALVVAAAADVPVHDLDDLWSGFRIDEKATHVRRAIWDLPSVEAGEAHPDDPIHVSPRFRDSTSARRMAAVPHDGGSWADLFAREDADELTTPSMRRIAAAGRWGSYPDVYGRLAWDRPAPTIKRECGHVGNGRYAHPEQDRLVTVREMATLQGFPADYAFTDGNLANMYRHVGDAVPPVVSYQLAHLCAWMLSDERPDPDELILPGTHLVADDISSIDSLGRA